MKTGCDNMKITNKISDYIFRGYDIRGIYEKDLTIDGVYTIGRGFGSVLKTTGKTETIIGYDNRESSPALYEALTKGITDSGITVISIGMVTTPMYYYALTHFKGTSGIMITGSHNPKEYNGLKMTFNGVYNAYGETIQDFKAVVNDLDFVDGTGEIIKRNIKEDYINYINSTIKLGKRPLKVVLDAGNGTASVVVKEVFEALNINYIPIFCESDPTFPNHHPDSSIEENMKWLKEKVLEEKADVGFAFDGDADRFGVIDENGKMMATDQAMIIFIRDLLPKISDKRISYDVKCSKAVDDEIKKLGGTPICIQTGNSIHRAFIAKENNLFGGEYSGHVWFNDKFHGFDDGIYCALRMVEILSYTDKPLSTLLDGVEKYYSSPVIKMKVPDEIKFEKIELVKKYCIDKGYKTLTIDGCKILFEDGFALIRASNTSPNITTRYEGKTESRLKEIKTEFEKLLKKIL